MLMADTMAIVFVVLGFLLALPGLWLVCRALWPGVVERSRARCEARPIVSFLVGAALTLGAILVSAVVGKVAGGAGQIAAFAISSLFAMFAHTGVAGLASHLGRRLPSPADAGRPWRETLRGGVVLELSYLVPILGWFVILPVSIVLGAGAAALAIVLPGRAEAAARAPVAPAEETVQEPILYAETLS